ncbi:MULTISPECIES: hypothetical protein [unclassified Micromonospora]|uniref:hypothetical protein n=1 Tax=unclassified Micromonospora TaxID=2617518 RepID=UPI003333D760
MPVKQLYYSKRKKPLVEAAERVASAHDISFSRLVTDALEAYVPKIAASPAPTPPERWDEIGTDSPNAA